MTTKNAFPSFHRNPSVNKSNILLVLFSETWELLAMCWQEKNSEKPQIKSYSLESKLTSYEHLTSWQLGQLTKDGSSSRMYVGALNHAVAPGSSICRNTQDCCPPPIKSSGCFSLTDCAPILELPHHTLPTSLSAANVDSLRRTHTASPQYVAYEGAPQSQGDRHVCFFHPACCCWFRLRAPRPGAFLASIWLHKSF